MTTWRWLTIGLGLAAALEAQPDAGGYSGPNVLSRWSGLQKAAPTGPVLQAYLHGSYAFMEGLVGPVTGTPSTSGTSSEDRFKANAHSAFAGGGLSFRRANSRGALSLNYGANYARPISRGTGAYSGLNQAFDLMYERQLTRRWGFYTGHSANTQSTILGLSRPTGQRNFFEPTFSPTNEALDARLGAFSSGAGFYFQKSRRLSGSVDGGVFAISRQSQALVSSRGERASGEVSYRFSRNQSIGAIYSYSHFYFPRGFGETYVQSAMLSYTRRLNRNWSAQLAGGPYRTMSDRLRTVAVDPYIAALTGNASTIEAFKGTSGGVGVNAGVGGLIRRRGTFNASYRRGIDAGNGLTLSARNDAVQVTYGFQGTGRLGAGASAFFTRLTPVLSGADRNVNFQSYGAGINVGFRIANQLHMIGNVGVHKVTYQDLGVDQFRRVAMVGLAYSPGSWSLMR